MDINVQVWLQLWQLIAIFGHASVSKGETYWNIGFDNSAIGLKYQPHEEGHPEEPGAQNFML